jgi:hypothetical protein
MNNIQVYLVEIGSSGADWLSIGESRDFVNAVMKFRFQENAGKQQSDYTTDEPSFMNLFIYLLG